MWMALTFVRVIHFFYSESEASQKMLSGDRLKFLRYMHGKTQKQMAQWCDCTTRYVAGVERGEFIPSEEIYNAWINCVYNVGEPIKRVVKNRKKVKEEE